MIPTQTPGDRLKLEEHLNKRFSEEFTTKIVCLLAEGSNDISGVFDKLLASEFGEDWPHFEWDFDFKFKIKLLSSEV